MPPPSCNSPHGLQPPAPLGTGPITESLFQILAVACAAVGAWYIGWRWTASLDGAPVWFSYPLVIAETGAYVGLLLFFFNLWRCQDPEITPPPALLSETLADPHPLQERPLTVDLFFTTFDEDPELVRLGLIDAKRLVYPHPITVHVHVLDDGRRPAMAAVAAEEGVGYITRDGNAGFKAGNLRHAMERTAGDFLVICDADTRPFPTLLTHTLGYFRDTDVAWVQTPQWFHDLPEGTPLPAALGQRLGRLGRIVGRGVEACFGPVRLGWDPFFNDPQMFYDVIQRRRNWAGASFCCGAGSIHRRDAVMEAALKAYADQAELDVRAAERQAQTLTGEIALDPVVARHMRRSILTETELTPYRFHVSEDIYTSIILHSDGTRRWRSVLHPHVESRMLSPQDLLSWTVQRFKYAGGSLDLLVHDRALLRRGLRWPARLFYAATFYSYLGGLWNAVFMVAPLVYLYSGIAPVSAYSTDFFLHLLPFLILHEVAMVLALWGLSGWRGKAGYLAFFPLNLKAIATVLKGKKIAFPVTPKVRQEGRFTRLIAPQIAVAALTAIGIAWALTALALGLELHTPGGVIANLFWAAANLLALSGIIRAAFWRPPAAV